jgi:hypothetical protein
MRLMLIGCGLLVREWSDAIVRSPHLIDVALMPAALHSAGAADMRNRLQAAIDAVDRSYDAILLGYGLCGCGVVGLQARATRLVLARADDCITLLMGARDRYRAYFRANPGTYYRSAGWVERAADLKDQLPGLSIADSLDAMIQRYGEENGRYLYQELTAYRRTYRKLAFICTGSEPNTGFADAARAEAEKNGWAYQEIAGDLSLFQRLLAGQWERDFLVIPPGGKIVATFDGEIVAATGCASKTKSR